MDKNKAIEICKDIIECHRHIDLNIVKDTVNWNNNFNKINFDDIKSIGYISALSFAFDITDEDVK